MITSVSRSGENAYEPEPAYFPNEKLMVLLNVSRDYEYETSSLILISESVTVMVALLPSITHVP